VTTLPAIIPDGPIEGVVVEGGFFIEENPFRRGAMRFVEADTDGWTVAQFIDAAAATMKPQYRPHLEAWIDEARVERAYWNRVKPKAGRCVYVRVRPRGKTGKNILRAVIMIAIVAAAFYFLGPTAGIWGSIGLSGFGATLASALAIAAITTLSQLALNALIPAPGLTGDNNKDPRFQLTGSSNQYAPYRAVPRVFGQIRVYPVVAGHPYTEIVGKKQYLRMLLMFGWGPLDISDIRIGDTPLTAFKNVEYEVSEGGPTGWAGNKTIKLYNRKVTEEQLSIETLFNVASAFHTTAANAVEIGVDIAFPYGLMHVTKKGDHTERKVRHKVEYRVAGSGGAWIAAPLETAYEDDVVNIIAGGTIEIVGKTTDVVRGTARFKLAAGQYEVRVTRTTTAGQTSGTTVDVDRSYWTALRTFSTDAPVLQEGVCLLAIRMQASEQLNGVPSQINALVKAYMPDWANPNTFSLSRSPARAFADILRRRGGKTYLADSRIDLTGLQAWDTDCNTTAPNAAENRWTYDAVIEGGTVFDALKQICAAGRAALTLKDGLFSAVQDKAQSTPVQLITPRNSWGYRGNRLYLDQPHAYRVEFQNAAKDYKTDELIVYNDGYDSTNATLFEVLQLVGVTSDTLAWREARYHMAVAKLRPEEHRVNMDIEGLRCTLGDRVQLAHDVMAVGTAYGRIASLVTSGANTIGFVLDNEVEFEVGNTYQLRVREADGTQSVRTVTNTQSGTAPTTQVSCAAEATSGGPQPGDVFVFGETAIESAPMIVKRIEPGDDLSVTLTLTNYDTGIYTADTGVIPPFTSYISTDIAKTPPGDPVVAIRADGTVHQGQNGNWLLNRLGVDISPPASGPIVVVGHEVQYREVFDQAWRQVGDLWPVNTLTVYCDPVLTGHAYQVRVRAKAASGLYSNWVQPSDIVVIGTSVPPDTPTSPSATAGYRCVYLSYVVPDDLDIAYVEILASQTNNSATGVVVGRDIVGSFTHSNLNGGATWFYWLRAVDFAGNVSALTSTLTATALSIANYEGIGADGVLTPAEKQIVIREFTQLTNEKAGIDTAATTFGVTTQKTNYDNAYAALNTYLTGLSPAYNDTSQNTTIVRATWNTNWSALYSTRQALLNQIDNVASTLAQWPNISDTDGTMPDPGSTGGDTSVPDSGFDHSGGGGSGFGFNWGITGGIVRASV
jgi:predicted phage tail protein